MSRHRVLWVISLLLSLIFFLPNISFSAQEQRLALLIGNSNYIHGGSLPNPVNDVRDMAKILEGLGFTVIKYENCSQKTMKRAMDKFGRKLKGKDVGLFFYAGHGVQVNGHNYLLPVDAKLENENDAEYDCVRAGRILAKMEAAGSRTNIVILDACRDNPFERSWRRGEKGSGLAFMNAPSGSLIAYSTAPGQTALDGGGRNSPYTAALLKNIETPNITVLQMFQRVRLTVERQSDKKQIPWESTSLRGDFYFRDGRNIKVVNKENEKPAIIETGNAKLFVDTEPEDARVRIVNIKPIFYQGIELELGHYLIEVSKNGYKTKTILSKLITDGTKTLYIQLESIKMKTPSQPQKPTHSFSNMSNADRFYKQGKIFLDKKQYAKAIQSFTQAIALNPNIATQYEGRGDAYYYLKQYTKAIQDFTHAIALDPKDANQYKNRGNAYVGFKQYTKAIQDFTHAIALDPNTAKYYKNRGNAYFDLKQYTKAIQDFTHAIALDPNIKKVYHWRGYSYLYLQQYTRAIQDFTQAIDLGEQTDMTYIGRATAYIATDRYASACRDAKRSCELGECMLLNEMKIRNYNCQ